MLSNKWAALLLYLTGCVSTSVDRRPVSATYTSRSQAVEVVSSTGSITLVPKDIELTWVPSHNTDAETVASYRIYYDTETRFDNDGTWESNYLNFVDVGNVTNCNLVGLRGATTYYLAATVIDQNGVESSLSPEVAYTTPFVMDLAFAFDRPVSNVVLQASSDLMQWQDFGTIPTNGVWRVTGQRNSPAVFFRGKATSIP